MRVVVVEPRGSGGMIHYAFRLCTAMAEQGAQVTLITSTDYELVDQDHVFDLEPLLRPTSRPAGPAATGGGRLGALLRRVRRIARLANGLRLLVTEWLRLTRRLLEIRPDVVQFGSIEHAIEGVFLWHLRVRGLRLTGVVHEPEVRTSRGLRWAVDVRLYRQVYRLLDAIFVHGAANRRRFADLYPAIPRDRVHSIEMGSLVVAGADAEREIDWRGRYGFPDTAPVIVFFGTLLPSKGLEDLLEAWTFVAPRRPDARLLVAGHPSRHMREGELAQRADGLGIGGTVTIDERYVPNEEVAALMGRARAIVLPYRSATQSGALQVAYANGRPVVVTRVGALPEVVEEGRSGLVVPPEAPGALAEAMLALIDDPDTAERMGRHARLLSETRHSWTSIATSVLGVYRSLVSA